MREWALILIFFFIAFQLYINFLSDEFVSSADAHTRVPDAAKHRRSTDATRVPALRKRDALRTVIDDIEEADRKLLGDDELSLLDDARRAVDNDANVARDRASSSIAAVDLARLKRERRRELSDLRARHAEKVGALRAAHRAQSMRARALSAANERLRADVEAARKAGQNDAGELLLRFVSIFKRFCNGFFFALAAYSVGGAISRRRKRFVAKCIA